MAQQLRPPTAFAEDPSFFPRIRVRSHTAASCSNSRGFQRPWPMWASALVCTYPYKGIHHWEYQRQVFTDHTAIGWVPVGSLFCSSVMTAHHWAMRVELHCVGQFGQPPLYLIWMKIWSFSKWYIFQKFIQFFFSFSYSIFCITETMNIKRIFTFISLAVRHILMLGLCCCRGSCQYRYIRGACIHAYIYIPL